MTTTVKIDMSNPLAQPLVNYLEKLPFATVERKRSPAFEKAVAECDGRPATEFFDDLRKEVKNHFRNA